MKSESQLCNELGLEYRTISSIRKKFISKSLWTQIGNLVYYTDKGEHLLRNEIQKKVLSILDAWNQRIYPLLSDSPPCSFTLYVKFSPYCNGFYQ